MSKELHDIEVECLKLKKAINDNHKLAQKAAGDAVERALLAGELIQKWKELLPHGAFEKFVETHFEGSLRVAQTYMQAAKGLSKLPKAQSSALLKQEPSIKGLLTGLKPPKKSPGKDGSSGKKPPGSDPPAAGSGRDEPEVSSDNLGKCPNCASAKWDVDEFGATCAKCGHVHGEATGGADEDRVKTQAQKTVKTAEALLRAFDDLNMLLAKPAHTEAVASCKFLIKCAKGWK